MIAMRHMRVFWVVCIGWVVAGCAPTTQPGTESGAALLITRPADPFCAASQFCLRPALSLLNPMENVDYLTRAEPVVAQTPGEQQAENTQPTTDADQTMTDQEEN